MADVMISYTGLKIASMEGSGVKTLLTSGKYCEDDIYVSYSKKGNATAKGDSSISVNNAESGYACSLIQYGVCEQDDQTNAISCNNGTLSISGGEIVITAENRESITLGSQTATVENLYSVGNVRDEHELVTGTVIRKNAACIYDGTQPVGDRYISSTGAKDNGAIIIYPLETEYTGNSIVSFTETVEQDVNLLEARIELSQDLHGYSNPWPGGGGVNILPMTNWFQAGYTSTYNGVTMTVNADGSITLSGTANPQADFYLSRTTNGITLNPLYVDAGTYTISMTGTQTISGVKLVMSGSGQNGYPYSEAPSNGAAKTGAVTDATQPFNYFLLRITSGTVSDGTYYIQFESGPTATSWTPYENICPISGLIGLSVYRTGKNLIDPAKKVIVTGSTTTARWYKDGTGFLLHGGQAYALSSNISTDATYFVYFYDLGGTQLAYGKWTATYTPTNDTYVYIQYYESGGAHLADAEFQLELGSTASTYEAYKGNTYSVEWSTQAGTVYGGTVDVVTGALTVDKAGVDLGSVSWTKYGSTANYDRYITSGIDSLTKNSSSVVCSIFKPRIGSETIVANMIWIASGNSKLSATTDVGAYANASDFKSGMSGQMLVYELATPQTYQLTAQEVETMVGVNNVFSPDAASIKIVVSNPVIEHVTPQPLALAEGSNTVTATNLSVSSVPLKLEYDREISVYAGAHHSVVAVVITFTIDDITYSADSGMTWTQWCESAHNTDGFVCSNGYVLDSMEMMAVEYNASYVSQSETIVENCSYVTAPYVSM